MKTLGRTNSFASMNLITFTFAWLFLFIPLRSHEVYQVDTEASTIRWTGSKVIGEHYGTLQLKEGSLRVEDNQLQGGDFTIDMRTLVNEDLEGDRREKLENWLRSEEMFYVERYPEVKFEITSAQLLEEDERYRLEGQLTIKDISHSITFPARVRQQGNRITAEAKLTFDRTRWNLNYGSGGVVGGLGNFAIEDEVSVEISLQADSASQ